MRGKTDKSYIAQGIGSAALLHWSFVPSMAGEGTGVSASSLHKGHQPLYRP